MNDFTYLLVGFFIGLYAAMCVAAFLIYLDEKCREDTALTKKFAEATGLSVDEADKILNS